MNLTVPIKAQSSTRSWSRQLQSKSVAHILSGNRKAERKRRLFMGIAATLSVGTLIAGGIGGLAHTVAAKSNYSTYFNVFSRNNDNASTTSNSSKNTSGTTTTTPSTATPSTVTTPTTATTSPVTSSSTTVDTAASQQTPTVAASAATTATSPATTATIATPAATPVASVAVDTAAESATLTAAQASSKNTGANKSVAYSSGMISDASRNSILIFAGITAFSAMILYTVSFIGARTLPVTRRAIPIRYIVPVREGITQ